MADTPAPLLVYNRIAANRRNTHLLTLAFAGLLLPFVWSVSQYLVVSSTGGFPAVPAQGTTATRVGTLSIMSLSIVLAVAIAHVSSLYLFVLLLWRSGARRLAAGDEPGLRRVVENLCIAAGQPVPSLYVIPSSAPNAFAVGFDPQHARLIVTRGLLDLLERRELAAVLAHELSHIGNGDTNLSTTLAVLVGVVRLPLTMAGGCLTLAGLLHRHVEAKWTAAILTIAVFVLIDLMMLWPLVYVASRFAVRLFVHGGTTATPASLLLVAYVFVVAPSIALWLRKTISHQREFLADADAVLLTRDPEGLALALAKVSGAAGTPVHTGDATAHLFFVDPLPTHAFGRGIFASHPSIDARIDAVTRMGDVSVEQVLTAGDMGLDYRGRALLHEVAPGINLETETRRALAFAAGRPGSQFRLTSHSTPLYEAPDGWSPTLQQLPAGDVVALIGVEGRFARVQAAGIDGYIAAAAGAEPLDAVGDAPAVPHRGVADRS